MNTDVIKRILVGSGIQAGGQPLTPGSNLFLDRIPDNCAEGVLIRLPLAGIQINHYLPGYYKGSYLQIIVRSPYNASGMVIANAVSNLLTIYNTTYTDPNTNAFLMQVNHIFPKHLPIVFPRSPGNLIEFSINFDTNYVMG